MTGATRRMRHLFPILAAAIVALSGPPPARADTDRPALCEAAARRAAQATGVPVAVLRAISLTETGRKRAGTTRPWPWTVNMEGKGLWFPDRDSALAYVRASFAAGKRSFDIGCFQLNHRWHGTAFTDFEQMFDPDANALYAARFLKELHDETGDWSKAAGAYHSRTPKYANRYIARFEAFRAALAGPSPALPAQTAPMRTADNTPAPPRRINTYPLLRAGQAGALGSLVPVITGGQSLFAPVEPRG